jgi:hypothetical protein
MLDAPMERASPSMAAEVRALRGPETACLFSPPIAAVSATERGTGFIFFGNARFKKRPPNDQRSTVLESINVPPVCDRDRNQYETEVTDRKDT